MWNGQSWHSRQEKILHEMDATQHDFDVLRKQMREMMMQKKQLSVEIATVQEEQTNSHRALERDFAEMRPREKRLEREIERLENAESRAQVRMQAMREEYDKLAGAGAAARYEMEREMERVDLEQELRKEHEAQHELQRRMEELSARKGATTPERGGARGAGDVRVRAPAPGVENSPAVPASPLSPGLLLGAQPAMPTVYPSFTPSSSSPGPTFLPQNQIFASPAQTARSQVVIGPSPRQDAIFFEPLGAVSPMIPNVPPPAFNSMKYLLPEPQLVSTVFTPTPPLQQVGADPIVGTGIL